MTVAKLLGDPNLIAQNVIPALKTCFQNKQSWRLRFAVAENAAAIGKYLQQTSVNTQILPFYVTLLGDSEPEVRSEAVNRLFELAENANTALIVQKVLPSLKLQLATESSQHVKGSMAYAVCKLAECVS